MFTITWRHDAEAEEKTLSRPAMSRMEMAGTAGWVNSRQGGRVHIHDGKKLVYQHPLPPKHDAPKVKKAQTATVTVPTVPARQEELF